MTFRVPDPRPRKPSAKIPHTWKCGHEVNLDWVLDGYLYCPLCGSKYPKSKLNLIGRWLSYSKWHQTFRRTSVPHHAMMDLPQDDE
jgi:hypothetical protein